jgi:hypothetical protein
MFCSYDVDSAAEREGEAAERLAELLGTEPPQTRLQIALGYARAAAALGLSPRKMPGYHRADSCRVHHWINHRAPWKYFVYGPPASKRIPADGRIEQIRQARKRLERARKLLNLKFMPNRQTLAIPVASAVSGLGQRTLQRACEQGRIGRPDPAYRSGRRWIVTAGELRQLLGDKLAGRPVANQGRKSIAA